MKKTFLLLAAMCCLVMNSWADNCQLIGSSIPSGTGANARSIVNIQYNKDTKVLTFEDTYETLFTAYARKYYVYFYEYNKDYAIYNNPEGNYNPVFYGTACNDDAFIPGSPASASAHPAAHDWVEKTFNNCDGGVREIDLSTVIPQIAALGYNHVMVGILPSYRLSSTADWVNYSIYGDWHYWLMNVAHFSIGHIANLDHTFSEKRGPEGAVKIDTRQTTITEGEDTAVYKLSIYPGATESIDKSAEVMWQVSYPGTDNWQTYAKSTITPTEFNKGTRIDLTQDRSYDSDKGQVEAQYLRSLLVYDGDTMMTDELCILTHRYDIQLSGPISGTYKTETKSCELTKWGFDTISFKVAANDTIILQPSRSPKKCDVLIQGDVKTTSSGDPCVAGFTKSRVYTATVNTNHVYFYVGGEVAFTWNVLCGYKPNECGYTQLPIPTVGKGLAFVKWVDEYIIEHPELTNNILTDDFYLYAMIDTIPEGALSQRFYISNGKPVFFSKGNLQYQASTDTWRFAENQYDYIGDEAGNNTKPKDRATQAAWIDLFGFGTSGYNGLMPYETDKTKFIQTDITGTEYDWGVHNAISNGGNKKGQWRLLSYSEWQTLLANANAYVVTLADKGYIGVLVPKTFQKPQDATVTTLADGATLTMEDYNTYSEWGIPFFPMAGTSLYTDSEEWNIYGWGTLGHYLSSSVYESSIKIMLFKKQGGNFRHEISESNLMFLHTVRLVHDCVEPIIPTDIEEVTGDRLQVTGSRKVLRDGQLIIIRDGKTYNAQGSRL